MLVGLCFWNFITCYDAAGQPVPVSRETVHPAIPGADGDLSIADRTRARLFILRWRWGGAGAALRLDRFFGDGVVHQPDPHVILMFILGWSLAVLAGFVTAYFPDMQHLAEVGLQILFYATPIIYPADTIKGKLGWMISSTRWPHLWTAAVSAYYMASSPSCRVIAGRADQHGRHCRRRRRSPSCGSRRRSSSSL